MHRRRLAVDLRARSDSDCRSSIVQIEQDIAIIEAGLELFQDQWEDSLRPGSHCRLAG